VSAEQMEISRLKAELSRVRMERDILKKAAASKKRRRHNAGAMGGAARGQGQIGIA
jgi:transposase-like protein